MQLVQISDIHVGSFFKQPVFDTVVEEANKLKPDAIIITGDLTDEGLLFQFEYIHTQIKKFTCSNIIVLAGALLHNSSCYKWYLIDQSAFSLSIAIM
jgi:Icc protein